MDRERGKGEKEIHPDGNTTFSGYRHCWKAAHLKPTAGKASVSRPACACRRKKTQQDACAAPLQTNAHSCQLCTAADFILPCAHEDGVAREGREWEQRNHHSSKPLQTRKRGNKCITLYVEGTQACHLPNKVGRDHACSIERAALRGEQARDKAYCLAALAPSILLSPTYKLAGAPRDAATPSPAGPVQGGGMEQPLGTSPAWEARRGRGSCGVHARARPSGREGNRQRQAAKGQAGDRNKVSTNAGTPGLSCRQR